MGGGICHQKGKERGSWFEVQCVKNDIIAKEADGESASYERKLLKSWGKYKGWEDALEIPPRTRGKSTRKGLKRDLGG